MKVTPAKIVRIAGGSPDRDNIESLLRGLIWASDQVPSGLNHPHRFAHFIAQVAHESGRFRYDQEVWGPTRAQERYEDRADLGHSPDVPGEAYRFRGRGPIQLTGRHNYRFFSEWARRQSASAPDFEEQPDLVNTDPWEGASAVWYWTEGNPTGRSLNVFADDNNLEAITRKINGGLNGLQDRYDLYVRAALVLLGYLLEPGVVQRFQRDAGFTGRDVDDIAGVKTRAAMHEKLKRRPPMIFEVDTPQPAPPDVDLEAQIRDLRQRLAVLEKAIDEFPEVAVAAVRDQLED